MNSNLEFIIKMISERKKKPQKNTVRGMLTSLSVLRVFLSIDPCLTSSLFSLSKSLTLVQESLKKIISLPIVRFSFSKEEIRWLLSSSLESRISACCLSRLFSFSRSFLSFSSWELSCSRVLFWGNQRYGAQRDRI